MAAVNASNKYMPFWQYEMINYGSQQQAKSALFGELSVDEIWADYASWLDIRHLTYLDCELISKALTRLNLEIGLPDLESKIQQWFLSTTHEYKKEILVAFLDGLNRDLNGFVQR